MKICHITSAHNRYDERIFNKECVSLANDGNEVILICCDGRDAEKKKGVDIISFSNHKLSKKERVLLLLKNSQFIKYLLNICADIYQFHDIELIEIGRKLSKTKKVIFDSHENWKGYVEELLPSNQFIHNIYNKLFDLYYTLNLKKFSAVFTVSPNFVRDLKKYTDRVYMVSNYPLLKDINLIDEHKESYNHFIYIGTVYKFSNQINIVESLSNLQRDKNVSYKIIGKISDSLKERILKTEGSEKVEFINWVEKKELNKLLECSCAGLVLLDYVPICANKEGQMGSNKIFEYMMAGLPVICTDFSLWKKLIIDKYHCGICVNPTSVQEITEAMKFIINHPQEAKEMGKRGRFAVETEFNWECGKDNYLKIYRDIYNL